MLKKVSVLLFAMFATVQIANAQIQIGGGVIYGTELEETGIQVNGTFEIPGPFRFSSDIGIFLLDDVNFFGNTERGFWEANFNAHYLIPGIPKANIYGLGGINIVTATLKNDTIGLDSSDSEVGLNVGVGGEIPIGFATLFAEVKQVLGEADQAILTGGLRFSIGK